ncbi:hypothetical protein HanIR_Chr13g0618571 [Helianthus annuus]|nr:hypothetical protein HanIR_Chr13g0618571 [Helianthus annuus]
MHKMVMNAAQVIMAGDEASSQRLFRTRRTIKEKSLRSFKRVRGKILNGLLVFYKKNDKSLNIQHVRLHQSGYETLCTLVSSFITWSLKTKVERYASTMKTRLLEFQLVGNNKI